MNWKQVALLAVPVVAMAYFSAQLWDHRTRYGQIRDLNATELQRERDFVDLSLYEPSALPYMRGFVVSTAVAVIAAVAVIFFGALG